MQFRSSGLFIAAVFCAMSAVFMFVIGLAEHHSRVREIAELVLFAPLMLTLTQRARVRH